MHANCASLHTERFFLPFFPLFAFKSQERKVRANGEKRREETKLATALAKQVKAARARTEEGLVEVIIVDARAT